MTRGAAACQRTRSWLLARHGQAIARPALAALLATSGCLKLKGPPAPPQQYMETTDRYELLEVEPTATESAHFLLAGEPFCFGGTNNYYLTYKSHQMVDDVLARAVALDLEVIRLWAFIDRGSIDGSVPSIDGDGTKDGIYFQYWDPEQGRPAYNDGADGLQQLDYLLHAAREAGLKLILVLTNNWYEFGGMDQYLVWYGLDKHHLFYTDERVRGAYRAWVSHLVERVNSIDGVRYRDDPAILAWELANEPRCKNGGERDSASGWDSTTLTRWADEMSAHIKSIDPNHLVAVGDEGFLNGRRGHWTRRGHEGVDHAALLALEHVDFGTFHLYPDDWGTGYRFGYDWIEEHIAIAQELGKPTILEEYGTIVKRDEESFAITWGWKRRETAYRNWNNLMLNRGGNGSLFWMLVGEDDAGDRYPDYDHYSVYTGLPTANLLHEVATSFAREATACRSAPGASAAASQPSPFVTVRPPAGRDRR